MFGLSFYYARAKKTILPCVIFAWLTLPGIPPLGQNGDKCGVREMLW